MPAAPGTTPVPLPIFMPQTTPAPQAKSMTGTESKPAPKKGPPSSAFALPKLRLEVRDLNHSGSKIFLRSVVPSTAIDFAVQRVLELLYHSPDFPHTTVPGTRSVTLIIRPMEGVAYTTGSELDSDHKEIHFSADYINGIAADRKADEILGVLTHEMVHCYQYNGKGSCPGGLIEGIADWVRLMCNLGAPHWKREWDETKKWDAGYQHTAYFLDYIVRRYGEDTMRRLNEKLRTDRYEEKQFWTTLIGRPVEQLWQDYGEVVKGKETST